MKDTDFAYSVAYMRTLENKMLDQADIDALLNMPGAAEAVKFLVDRNYGGGDKVSGASKDIIDELLKAELEQAWQEIREACPKDAPIDVLLYQNDFQNLKTILKAVFDNSEWKHLMLYPSINDPEAVHKIVSENKMDELPELLRKPAQDAYELLARTHDGQRAEIVIDKAAFAAMQKEAEERKSNFLYGWVQLWATLSNMKTALRMAAAKKDKTFISESMLQTDDAGADALVEAAAQDVQAVIGAFSANGFEDGAEAAGQSISEFEKWTDNKLMDYVRAAQYQSFGFEPLLAYLYGKKAEAQALRIVLYGLLNHIPKSTLKERLRDLYV